MYMRIPSFSPLGIMYNGDVIVMLFSPHIRHVFIGTYVLGTERTLNILKAGGTRANFGL